jgi:hypothetical protein
MIRHCVESRSWGTTLRRLRGDEVVLVQKSFRLSAGSYVSLPCERRDRLSVGVKSGRVCKTIVNAFMLPFASKRQQNDICLSPSFTHLGGDFSFHPYTS